MFEIDYISIDEFTGENLKSYAYFLSHCHTDHMKGLASSEFETALQKNNAFIYMSAVSKSIIEKMYSWLIKYIKELNIEGKNYVDIPSIDTTITVTLIPAGHCPGSVMFLFEAGENVLYTGDIRIRVNELKKYKELYDSLGNVKRIDHIYLDTTFFNKMFEHFPLRKQSTSELLACMENWLNSDMKNIINIDTPANYGSEYILIDVYKKFNLPIHVDKMRYELYRCYPEMDKVVTLNNFTRIHYLCSCPKTSFLTTRLTAMRWRYWKPTKAIIQYSGSNLAYIAFSGHSSYTEIMDILKFLKPLKIFASVAPSDRKQAIEELITQTLAEIHALETDVESEESEEFQHKLCWTAETEERSSLNPSQKNVDLDDSFKILDSPKSKKKKY